jgi:hypothetical protein
VKAYDIAPPRHIILVHVVQRERRRREEPCTGAYRMVYCFIVNFPSEIVGFK